MYSTFGRHVIVDFYGINSEKLNDVKFLENLLSSAAKASEATVLKTDSYKFNPQGVTVYCVLSESHISIHTYPEHGYASVDCYTCGENVDPNIAINILIEELKPSKISRKMLIRGLGNIIDWTEKETM